ncbi:M28 family peptidase [Pilimelia anulata]|nr:M28 family peptidase [Pilimelia anulata]
MPELALCYRQAITHDQLRHDLTTVAGIDRLQGSHGLNNLADDIADRAAACGLDVQVRRYQPGAPDARWWNYTAPQAGSPRAASLTILGETGPVTSYPLDPCTLARGSASTPPSGIRAPLIDLARTPQPRVPGAFVISPPLGRFALRTLVEQLHDWGAIGLALRSTRREGCDDTVIDRMELPDGCPLVGFSVSASQSNRLQAAAANNGHVHVHAEHDPAAPMPLVYARRRHRTGGQLGVLIAHLCHPAPGADDNASGVAALLSIARAAHHIYGPDRGPNLAFLWAPEMVGTAAYLHDIADHPDHKPAFALSLDMLGGDPNICGGVLTIEQSPDHLPAPLAGALEAAARAVSPAAVSYSTAVQLPTWPRAVVPFVGASDHLLFADRSIGIPAAHITRLPNRFHHTSHDTTATISYPELHRAAVTTAVAVTALSTGGPALAQVIDAVADLGCRRLTALIISADGANTTAEDLRHTAEVADGALRTLQLWHPTMLTDINHTRAHLADIADRLIPSGETAPSTDSATAAVPLRRWQGPWNLHNLDHALSRDGRTRLARLLVGGAADYARLVAVAHSIDDQHNVAQIAARAARITALTVHPAHAHALLDVMAEAEWIAWQ